MITIFNQDRDKIHQVTQAWYEDIYFKKHWWSKKVFIGVNVYAHNLKGNRVLLGTFSDESEARE